MSKVILAIDPGTTESAFVRWDGDHLYEHGIVPNEQMLDILNLSACAAHNIVIEDIASYGMPVGAEVFTTVKWIGRFIQCLHERGAECQLMPRKDVKMHHCHSARAKDGNIRQALLDKYGAQGTKKSPGLTYGLKSHTWAAFALATCISEQSAR